MPWNRPARDDFRRPRTVRLPYTDRAEAGRVLAERLAPLGLDGAAVLALPRGGVPVGHEIARRLGSRLDVLVTRKIGYPPQPELGVGAIAEGGAPVFDAGLLARLGLREDDLASTVAAERAELDRRVAAYRGGRRLPDVAGRPVVVVDDGLATGGTARAAVRAMRERGPSRLVLAVPVGAAETVRSLETEADDVVVPAAPWEFSAVGQWYRDFEQLTDDDVIAWLDRAARAAGEGPEPT
ncbi:phosphoribosyltransferase [Actinomadura darangshiensis]|uniref:Phosphoribosyltransferase n=1 Tax=Actinomadura darangshiensis TaxID=705336 RepID=A0A4R5BFX1_9ACTN|nr:phosphoribosyltransferase family protein [Actinomadura darangshiensis]TDD85488.1 phosphoribosyltransferase [Actinomadura darangshiensis]